LVRLDYVIGYHITPENAIEYYVDTEGEKVGSVPESPYNIFAYEDALKDVLDAEHINIKPRHLTVD